MDKKKQTQYIEKYNYKYFMKNNKNIVEDWINVYKSVLNSSLDRFPYGFWVENKEIKGLCLTYFLINDILIWDKDTVLENFNFKVLSKYKLRTVPSIFEDIYSLVQYIYPEESLNHKDIKYSRYETKWDEEETIKQRELRKNKDNFNYLDIYKDVLNNKLKYLPNDFWNEESAKICLKYIFNEVLKWSKEDIYNNVTSKILKEDFKLQSILNQHFDLLKVIQIIYPETKEEDIKSLKLRIILSDNHKENLKKISNDTSTIEIYNMVLNKELDKFPKNFWNEERAKECLIYLVNDILKWSKDELFDNISFGILNKYKLTGPTKYIWNNDLMNIVNIFYPNTSIFEVKNVSKNWKDINIQKEFIIWLLEDKLNWTKEDIKEKFSRKIFEKDYSGFLKHGVNGDLVNIIELAYPNEIYAYEIKSLNLKKDYWDTHKEHMKNIIKEKIEKANIEIEDIPNVLTHRKIRLIQIPNSIFCYFNKSIFEMINFAYPNVFKEEDFK